MRGAYGLLTVMFGTLVLLAPGDHTSAATAPDPSPAHNDPWATQADGLVRAKQAIEQCLTSAGEGPGLPTHSCMRAAYTACEREHGTSQRDMNECSALSYEAWNARIADTMASFASAKSADTRLGPKTEEAKHQLVESQLRWSEWNAADCELQAKGTEGGSIRPFTISICLSDHAAMRAIDLQRLIEWWLG
jgi:uncharacterized protein YecT (DUF1311 family)